MRNQLLKSPSFQVKTNVCIEWLGNFRRSFFVTMLLVKFSNKNAVLSEWWLQTPLPSKLQFVTHVFHRSKPRHPVPRQTSNVAFLCYWNFEWMSLDFFVDVR